MLPLSLPRLPVLPASVLPAPLQAGDGASASAVGQAQGEIQGEAQAAGPRIGFTPLGLHRYLPCLLRRLRQVQPGLRPRLVELSPDALLEAVEQGRLDIGLVPQPACASPALRLVPLPPEPLLAALPATATGPVTLSVLAERGLVLFPADQAPVLHGCILRGFAAAGVPLDPPREAKRAAAMLELVAAGQGAALLPATSAQQRCPGIRLARIAGHGLPRLTMALALPRRRLDTAMQQLLTLLPLL